MVSGDELGSAVRAADLLGDGRRDAIVGADHEATVDTRSGAVYVLDQGIVDAGGTVDLLDAYAVIYGSDDYEALGCSFASADLDGDGVSDLILGGHDNQTWIVYGPIPAGVSAVADIAAASLYGDSTTGDEAGSTVGLAGDLDGDGRADFLIGDPEDSEGGSGAGAVYVGLGSLLP